MRLFQNEANAIAAWISGTGFRPRTGRAESVKEGENHYIYFDVDLDPRPGRTEPQMQAQYRAFLRKSPAEMHMDRPRIRPKDLVQELGLDLPSGDRECQHEGCEKPGERYWVPPARLYGIDNLYCPEHAEHAAENFESPSEINL